MQASPHGPEDPRALLERSLASGRLHSAYLIAGPAAPAHETALAFLRAMVCSAHGTAPCEACRECQRSRPGEPIALDGSGKKGPLLRHVGDHPDLLWVERGADDTRVRIAQIRELQRALRLRGEGAGRRGALIADAEWLNSEAQNALLRLLEEPPPETTLVLVATTPASLLATVRSRCQRVVLPADEEDLLASPEAQQLAQRFDALASLGAHDLLDWAAEFRGGRAEAAEETHALLACAEAWLLERVRARVAAGARHLDPMLDARRELAECRRGLDQRNANPQMTVERALLALREAQR